MDAVGSESGAQSILVKKDKYPDFTVGQNINKNAYLTSNLIGAVGVTKSVAIQYRA